MAKRTETVGTNAARNQPRDARGDLPASSDTRLAWIERMRVYRGRSEPDLSIGAVAASVERSTAQRQRALGDVIDVWNEVAPERVRGCATIEGLSQGTLTLTVATSSASYEVSRALRDGLERVLNNRMPTRVKRVKVRVAAEK